MMRFLKKKKIPAILKILLGVALTHCILPLQAFTAGNSDMPIHDATISISVIYGIIAALSLILAVGYCILVRKKEIWLVFMHFAVFLVNFGYFMLSVSKNLSFALAANRIAYLGAVFLPFFMLMTILDACRMKYHKPLFGCLIGISAVVYLIAASPGYLDCYYSSVAIVFVNGVAKLEKTYGPLHSLYYVYLFTYFAAMVAVICYSVIRKKINTWKHAALLAVVTLLNIIIWFVEQFIYWDFEFLSVSYLLSVLLLVFLYAMLEDYSRLQSRTVILEDKLIKNKDNYDLLLVHNLNDVHWRTANFCKVREQLHLDIYSLQEGFLKYNKEMI